MNKDSMNWECVIRLSFYGDADGIDIEDMYQAFKARLMSELVARDDVAQDICRHLPLVEGVEK